MTAFRSTSVLALGALSLAASVAGCTSLRRLSAEPPPTVSLAGTWTLDPLHSTDSRKVLHDLVKPGRRSGRSRGFGPAGGVNDVVPALGDALSDFPPDIALQKSLLAGGDWLKIEQRPDELVVTNADSSRSFVPGQRSVVSVPSGVADQRTGWKGREYWIVLRPQVGPSATEKLKLSDDGKRLIETIEVGSEGRVSRLEVRREYVPAQAVPASPVPSDD